MTTEIRHALAVLGSQNGLEDFRYFVGRKLLLLALEGCISGQGSAWLHGPRRIGKTTLSQRIALESEKAGSATILVDAGDIKATSFDTLLKRVVARAPPDIRATTGTATARFEHLEEQSKALGRPLLIVFDEFDHIAVNLGLDEQAFLRRLNGDYKRFRYLFVSRLDPAFLVEEVSEERSRLLGICRNVRVKPLERKEVRELLRRVGRDIHCEVFESHLDPIWDAVGGHTMAVVTIAHALAVQHACEEDEQEQLREAFRTCRPELDSLMSGFWRDLRPITRTCLMRPAGAPLTEAEEDAVRFDGLFSAASGLLRPGRLVERGMQLGVAPGIGGSDIGSVNRFFKVERLHGLMTSVNSRAKLGGAEPVFSATDESLKYFCLRRYVQDVSGVRDASNHLYKVLVEGARRPTGDKGWRLSPGVASEFRRTPGLQALTLLRNFFNHDPDCRANADIPSQRYSSVGEFYAYCCGTTTPPGPEAWTQVRDRLVDDAISALERLEELVASAAPSPEGKYRPAS